MNENTQSITQNTAQTCTALQTTKVIFGGTAEYCGAVTNITDSTINISGSAVSYCELNANVYAESIQDSITNIQEALQQAVTKDLENKQGWLSFAASIQISETDVISQIRANISNINNQTIIQGCEQTAQAISNQEIIVCADVARSTFNIDQNAYVYSTAQCTTCLLYTSPSPRD